MLRNILRISKKSLFCQKRFQYGKFSTDSKDDDSKNRQILSFDDLEKILADNVKNRENLEPEVPKSKLKPKQKKKSKLDISNEISANVSLSSASRSKKVAPVEPKTGLKKLPLILDILSDNFFQRKRKNVEPKIKLTKHPLSVDIASENFFQRTVKNNVETSAQDIPAPAKLKFKTPLTDEILDQVMKNTSMVLPKIKSEIDDAAQSYLENETDKTRDSPWSNVSKYSDSEKSSDILMDLLSDLEYHQVSRNFNVNVEYSYNESFINKRDSSLRLNIFDNDKPREEKQENRLNIMDVVESCEFKNLEMALPDTQFHEWIQWTKEKKMWKFPIDNEQDSDELNVGFHEHVFPQQYLSGVLPTTGLVGQYMNYVCIGLSQSPYLTVEQKKNHIKWYEEYFADKLEEINISMEKNAQDKLYEEKLRNK